MSILIIKMGDDAIEVSLGSSCLHFVTAVNALSIAYVMERTVLITYF